MVPYMSRFKQFIKNYWEYYKELEDEFLQTRKCVDFQKGNFNTYSVEFLKLFQAACSEIDVLGKAMAVEVNPSFMPDDKKNNITKWWYEVHRNYQYYESISTMENGVSLSAAKVVFLDDEEMVPWVDFETELYQAKNGTMRYRAVEGKSTPNWWRDYNMVKHNRTLPIKNDTGRTYYTKANLGNTLSAFAALFILEKAFMAHIGELTEREAFAGRSRLFEKVEKATSEDIDALINGLDPL